MMHLTNPHTLHSRRDSTIVLVPRILLLARISVAIVFVVAAIAKVRSRSQTVASVEEFGVSPRWSKPAAMALVGLEVIVAVLLLVPVTAAIGAIITVCMLLSFTVALSVQLSRGNKFVCGCFGSIDRSVISLNTIVRNLVLVVLNLMVIVGDDPDGCTLIQRKFGSIRHLIVVHFPLLLSVLNTFLILRCFKRIGVIVSTREHDTGGLRVGMKAPEFELSNPLSNERFSASSLESNESNIVLFTSTTCAYCSDVYPLIESVSNKSRVFVVVSGDHSSVIDIAKSTGLENVFWDQEDNAARLFLIPGTPSAVVIDQNLTVVSIASGVKRIEELLKEITS